jgi:iron complex transport system substrate-binding protein
MQTPERPSSAPPVNFSTRFGRACLPEDERRVNPLFSHPKGTPAAPDTTHSRSFSPLSRVTRRALLGLAAGFAAGCRPKRQVSVGVGRVVSLSPATTEAVYALGATLVGRSRFCDYPAEVSAVPSVGGFADPSFEAILALVPDLVVGVQGPGLGPELEQRIQARGIRTFFPPTDRMAEIDAMISGLGERLERAERGRELVRALAAHRARIARALQHRERPRALLVFGLRPIVVAGVGGFAHEMLSLAGADNAVKTPGARYPTLGIERVIALDPDVVVDATGVEGHDSETVHATLPGWSELRALRQGKLLKIRDARVLRPGPRIAEGLEVLARALHRDLVVPA